VNKWDYLGMWGTAVHYWLTKWWAESIFTRKAAYWIATADEAVDGGDWGLWSNKSFLPLIGDQSYHFNMPWSDTKDSRLEHFERHLDMAKESCSDDKESSSFWGWLFGGNMDYTDEPEEAAKHLGIALHPKQDYYAHGDYGKYAANNFNIIHHNKYAPPYSWLAGFGDASSYPDDPKLDAVGPTKDGRPAGKALGGEDVQLGMKYVWYHFEIGNKRITATKQQTLKALKDFKTHLKKQKKCCKCLKFFIGNGTTIPIPK